MLTSIHQSFARHIDPRVKTMSHHSLQRIVYLIPESSALTHFRIWYRFELYSMFGVGLVKSLFFQSDNWVSCAYTTIWHACLWIPAETWFIMPHWKLESHHTLLKFHQECSNSPPQCDVFNGKCPICRDFPVLPMNPNGNLVRLNEQLIKSFKARAH